MDGSFLQWTDVALDHSRQAGVRIRTSENWVASCSPLLKQAGRTDGNSSLQSIFEQASKQSAKAAESLREATSRGSNTEAILRDGQQMLSRTLENGEHLFNQTARGDGPVQRGLQQVLCPFLTLSHCTAGDILHTSILMGQSASLLACATFK